MQDKNEYNLYNPIKKPVNIDRVFLVSLIIDIENIKPLFIVNSPTFGLEQFNIWKNENGFSEKLSKIEPIQFITADK